MTILTHIWSAGAYIVPFIFVLSLVVFFHELGHFLVGRWCGVKVDAFSLGFGPEIFISTTGTARAGASAPCRSAAMSSFMATPTAPR